MPSCNFDRVPYEVLQCIIEWLQHSRRDLIQTQLVCRRWQIVAEIHLFRDLYLYHHQQKDAFKQLDILFSTNSERAKLVKNLFACSKNVSMFTDQFFDMFTKIENVRLLQDWKLLYRTFTPERCSLRHLFAENIQANGYIYFEKVARAHSPTLLNLVIPSSAFSPLQTPRVLLNIGYCGKLKRVSFTAHWKNFQQLDSILHLYPYLKCVEIDIYDIDNSTVDTHSYLKKQHYGRSNAKRIKIKYAGSKLLNILRYIDTKFSTIQECYIGRSDEDIEKFDVAPLSFQDVITTNILTRMLQSRRFFLRICLQVDSISAAFGYLFSLPSIPKTVNIYYQGHTAYARKMLDSQDSDIVDVQIKYDYQPQRLLARSYTLAIGYLPGYLYHMKLLEGVGHYIRELRIEVDTSKTILSSSHNTINTSTGDMLLHVIKYCPYLTDLYFKTYKLQSASPACPFRTTQTNSNLVKVRLECETLSLPILTDLSHQAPSIKNLALDFFNLLFDSKNIQRSAIFIDMPASSLESLAIFGLWSVCCKKCVKVTSSKSKHSKHFYSINSGSGVKSIDAEAYVSLASYVGCYVLEVHCKSVGRLSFGTTPQYNSITFYPDDSAAASLR